MLTRHEPSLLEPGNVAAQVGSLLAALDLSGVVAMPLIAGNELLGVATASWRVGRQPSDLSEALARLRASASTAPPPWTTSAPAARRWPGCSGCPSTSWKMNRSFTSAITDDARSPSLARGILALAEELAIEVVAERVETMEQLAALRTAGFTLVQGWGSPSRAVRRRGRQLLDARRRDRLVGRSIRGEAKCCAPACSVAVVSQRRRGRVIA